MQWFLSAFFGLLAGIAGSIFAPWVNWGIEKRRQKLAYRRELIASWRKMIRDVTLAKDESGRSLAELLERHEAFYSIKPHLSQNVISEIYRCRTVVAGSTICYSVLLHPCICSYMLKEIGEIEKKWKLV